MKKILLGLALSFGLVGALNAQDVDVLALVTKGKVTSDSAGVTKLSLDDKMQVKGGSLAQARFYVSQKNNYGQPISYTEYWQILPDSYENKTWTLQTLPNGPYSSLDYQSFKWFTSLDPQNEIVTIMGTYDFKTQTIFTRFVILNVKTKSHRYMDNHPVAQNLLKTFDSNVRAYVYNNRYR